MTDSENQIDNNIHLLIEALDNLDFNNTQSNSQLITILNQFKYQVEVDKRIGKSPVSECIRKFKIIHSLLRTLRTFTPIKNGQSN